MRLPVAVSYHGLNPVCAYCDRDAGMIRVTETEAHGFPFVSTMCLDHAIAEAEANGLGKAARQLRDRKDRSKPKVRP